MVKHNNVVPNQHFKKHWQRRVRTWFDQPMNKARRRALRAKKAARLAPRPTEALRPLVRCPTIKYNKKVRYGRGFTLEELKEAGINRKFARTIGIAVDHRRKNHCVESLQLNSQRLKEYQSRLILFPKRANKPKSGDSPAEELATAQQVAGKPLPLTRSKPTVEAREITEDERNFRAYHTLRNEWNRLKFKGKREKHIREKAEAEAK